MFGFRRRESWLIAVGAAVSLASWAAFRPWNLTDAFMIGAPFGRDFANFWLAPRLVLAGQGALLADIPAYNAAISEQFGYVLPDQMVFSYPPHALVFLAPFGLLAFLPALLAWTVLNLSALAAATRLVLAEDNPRARALIVAACLSPAAVAMVTYGHFGGLIALAVTVAIRDAGRRPWIAGLCVAALSVKPQFAGLLGLFLVCGGHWRWLPGAVVGTLGLIALSLGAFGLDPWERFLAFTMPFQTQLLTQFVRAMISTTTSVYVTAKVWGAADAAAWAVQAAAGVLALLAATAALRLGRPGPRRLLVAILAMLVALPYANHYDLAILAPSLTPLVLDRDIEPALSPLLAALWLVAPLAKILSWLGLPLISVVMAAVLLAETIRLLDDRPRIGSPAASGALTC